MSLYRHKFEGQLSYFKKTTTTTDARTVRNLQSINALITIYWGTNGPTSKVTSNSGAMYVFPCVQTLLWSLIF